MEIEKSANINVVILYRCIINQQGFILQLEGDMKLSLYESICELPLESNDDLSIDEDELNFLHEVVLRPGDVVSLKRGVVHIKANQVICLFIYIN